MQNQWSNSSNFSRTWRKIKLFSCKDLSLCFTQTDSWISNISQAENINYQYTFNIVIESLKSIYVHIKYQNTLEYMHYVE